MGTYNPAMPRNIMKRFFSLLTIGLMCNIITLTAAVRIMTFNYRKSVSPCIAVTDTQKKEKIEFAIRRSLADTMFHDIKPDIIALQEPHRGDLEFFEDALAHYAWAAEPIVPLLKQNFFSLLLTLGKAGSDYNAIFYDTHKFTCLKKGDFGLNKELEMGEPSTSWNIKDRKYFHVRGCSWVRLQEKSSGNVFWVFNTHLSLEHLVRQKEFALIVGEILKKVGNEPVIFLGDFNTLQLPKIVTQEFVDTKQVAQAHINPDLGTYKKYVIDYILMRGIAHDAVQLSAVVDDTQYTKDSITPSDHRALYVNMIL